MIHPLNVSEESESKYQHTRTAKTLQYPDRFFDNYRLLVASISELLHLVDDKIQKRKTEKELPISPKE